MRMKHPHRAAASFTLSPPAPIALASSKRLTYATYLTSRRWMGWFSNPPPSKLFLGCSSWARSTFCTWAGNSASATMASLLSDHVRIWHTSPPSRSRMAFMRTFSTPTQASTGSHTPVLPPPSRRATATLLILPLTRAMDLITTSPEATSGTSAARTLARSPAMAVETMTGARLSAAHVCSSTVMTSAHTRSPWLYFLPGMPSSAGSVANAPSSIFSRYSPWRPSVTTVASIISPSSAR
mmetsp:Transcript_9891/g.24413  ORF Transcript_9891/g.24413 Transcript_9891/m.24413 type:complete len:239 (-) Transcript_9891:587-1303(-)